jgi:hypothetical protein
MKGRKKLCTPSLRKRICDLLARGHTIKTSCGLCGCSERSFFDWCDKDSAFFAATQRARTEGKVRIIDSILSSPDWRAKAWYLERCYSSEFARTEPRIIVVEREREPASDRPTEAQTVKWMRTQGDDLPLSAEQLAYIARVRGDHQSGVQREGNGKEQSNN